MPQPRVGSPGTSMEISYAEGLPQPNHLEKPLHFWVNGENFLKPQRWCSALVFLNSCHMPPNAPLVIAVHKRTLSIIVWHSSTSVLHLGDMPSIDQSSVSFLSLHSALQLPQPVSGYQTLAPTEITLVQVVPPNKGLNCLRSPLSVCPSFYLAERS